MQIKKKLSSLFFISSGTTPSTKEESNYASRDIPWLNSGDFHDSLITETKNYISQKALDIYKLKVYPKNSLIVAMYGANVGEVGITTLKTTVNQACCVLVPKKHVNCKFYFYWLIGYKQFFINQAFGGGQANINQNIVKNTYVDYPIFSTQTAIANYLDYHTTKIDSEISYLEKKSSLLEEYKQSLIFETVTKGLDKSVPMRDSGIDWIGKIPAHWEVKRVKEVALWQTGFTPDTKNVNYYDGYDDWITIGDMDNKYIEKSKNKINGAYFKEAWKTPANSLLFSFKLSIGQVAFNKHALFTNEAICSFLKKSKINLNYFYYASPIFITKNAKKNIYNADLLNQDLIANAKTLFPSLDEQQQIANYLDHHTTKIDKQRELMQKKIELLKEYKQSLIYEAVTGKIEIPQEFYKEQI